MDVLVNREGVINFFGSGASLCICDGFPLSFCQYIVLILQGGGWEIVDSLSVCSKGTLVREMSRFDGLQLRVHGGVDDVVSSRLCVFFERGIIFVSIGYSRFGASR